MENNNKQFQEICEGVLVFNGGSVAPNTIHINGELYERFLDYVYLNCHVNQLNKEQVTAVCELRETHLEWQNENSPNSQVRQLFSQIIMSYHPEFVFEVGPGVFPLFLTNQQVFNYMQGDLDERVVEKNNEAGYETVHFDLKSSLPITDNSIDLAVGVFVLQFEFSHNQINEIARILKVDGVFLVNVYHRDDAEKQNLIDGFERAGLTVRVYPDLKELCKQHQYWVISKSASGGLHEHCRTALVK